MVCVYDIYKNLCPASLKLKKKKSNNEIFYLDWISLQTKTLNALCDQTKVDKKGIG